MTGLLQRLIMTISLQS